MVDADAVERPIPQPTEHQLVGVVEDLGVFDADGCQAVDVEEAAVVQVPAGRLPAGEAIVLLLEKVVETVAVATDRTQHGVHGGRDLR